MINNMKLKKPKIICGKCGFESIVGYGWRCHNCRTIFGVIIKMRLQDRVLGLARGI